MRLAAFVATVLGASAVTTGAAFADQSPSTAQVADAGPGDSGSNIGPRDAGLGSSDSDSGSSDSGAVSFDAAPRPPTPPPKPEVDELALERAAHAAKLASARRAQEHYDDETTELYGELPRTKERFASAIALVAGFDSLSGTDDPRYRGLSRALGEVRTSAIDSLRALLRDIPRVPRPPKLSRPLRQLIGQESAARFDAIEDELAGRVSELATRRRAAQTAAADHFRNQAIVLTRVFVSVVRRSPELSGQLKSFSTTTLSELGGESVQAGVLLGNWLRWRLIQIRRIPTAISTSSVIALVWGLSKFILLLLALIWALRRWDRWMMLVVEFVGRSLTYGQSALLLVRLAESAKKFGPPLLVLICALASYRIFDFGSDVELVLQLVIAVSALRVQLKLIESAAERLARRSAERANEQALLEAESATTDAELGEAIGETLSEPAPAPAASDAADLEPSWKLFIKTWRRLTRYVAVVAVILIVANFTLGKGVFYSLFLRWTWLGAIPLVFFFLRTWRARIVHELTVRAKDDDESLLGRLARRHSHRIYGLPIVFAAFVIVLGRRSAAFVKEHFFELNSTKRALAFLFRRQVQKHAKQTGRVIAKPLDLPDAITAKFGALRAHELGPIRTELIPELVASLEHWQKDGVDGSVALIGESGMGKTCLMESFARQIDGELGATLISTRLTEKITRPHRMIRWLATELGIDGSPTTEAELVAEIRKMGPQVIMIDCCHHLFLRRVGGFDAWEAFVRVVNDCGKSVFWVLSFGKAAWDYLANVSGRVAYFRKTIKMPPWSETDLRRLILTRMRRSGFKVNFSDLLVTKIEGVKMNSQIIRTSQGYFRLLWDYAKGNPTLASFFWLRSLVPEGEGRSVRVNLFTAPSIEELEKLPDDIAFVLTAIVEHESASALELAEITNLSLELCRFAVRFGKERGYLERLDNRFVISRFWKQTIMTHLKRRHLLYS